MGHSADQIPRSSKQNVSGSIALPWFDAEVVSIPALATSAILPPSRQAQDLVIIQTGSAGRICMTTASSIVLHIYANDTSRETRTQILRDAGFHVVEDPGGELASALAVTHQPALILLDLQLPDRDGCQLCRELKQSAEAANVPVLAILGCRGRRKRLCDRGGIRCRRVPERARRARRANVDRSGAHWPATSCA